MATRNFSDQVNEALAATDEANEARNKWRAAAAALEVAQKAEREARAEYMSKSGRARILVQEAREHEAVAA